MGGKGMFATDHDMAFFGIGWIDTGRVIVEGAVAHRRIEGVAGALFATVGRAVSGGIGVGLYPDSEKSILVFFGESLESVTGHTSVDPTINDKGALGLEKLCDLCAHDTGDYHLLVAAELRITEKYMTNLIEAHEWRAKDFGKLPRKEALPRPGDTDDHDQKRLTRAQ